MTADHPAPEPTVSAEGVDVAGLRELLAAATHEGGRWSNGDPGTPVHAVFSGAVCVAGLTRTKADAALIAAAVNALPALLDELAAARELLRVVEGGRDAACAARKAWQSAAAKSSMYAESAEAAHAALLAKVEALADRPVGYDYGSAFVYCDDLRALLDGVSR